MGRDDVEVVERKGMGHPDTICDALAEALSRNLCDEYRRRFGVVLHHNVDKALLCGGRALPAFGAGSVTDPIRIILAGRAVSTVRGEKIPIEDIAVEGSRAWLKANLHALDVDRHVGIEPVVQQGSQDLQSLFSRGGSQGVPLANDTSFGVGHAPLSSVESLVLDIERQLHGRDRSLDHPAWGEDIKIMAVRRGPSLKLIVACAMIGRFLDDIGHYFDEKAVLAEWVRQRAREHGFGEAEIIVNAADEVASASVYLTVTGTSAEGGDDGQVGRGNRVSGLITPWRPMSLEAAAGKNPISHVGKIYNVLATRLAQELVTTMPELTEAHCLIVSQIGAQVSMPSLVHLKLATRDRIPFEDLRGRIEKVTDDQFERISELVSELIAGTVQLF
jgi:S-adenosylmethionine synthetase